MQCLTAKIEAARAPQQKFTIWQSAASEYFFDLISSHFPARLPQRPCKFPSHSNPNTRRQCSLKIEWFECIVASDWRACLKLSVMTRGSRFWVWAQHCPFVSKGLCHNSSDITIQGEKEKPYQPHLRTHGLTNLERGTSDFLNVVDVESVFCRVILK